MTPQRLCRDNPDIDSLSYPLLCSPKLDGIRCLITDHGPLTLSLKEIPNREIFETLSAEKKLIGLDGELLLGEPTHPQVFNRTTSYVRSKRSQGGDWHFVAFDHIWLGGDDRPFSKRYAEMSTSLERLRLPHLGVVCHDYVFNPKQLLAYEARCLGEGFEGIVIRHPSGRYKYGRTTMREENAWKLKRFSDHEAYIIGMTPLQKNQNPAYRDETGAQKRSKAKSGLQEMPIMGTLILEDCETGVRFEVGTGFTAKDRDFWYSNWKTHKKGAPEEALITYKKFTVGELHKPRLPVFKGWRMKEDV